MPSASRSAVERVEVGAGRRHGNGSQIEGVGRGEERDAGIGERVGGHDVAGPGQRAQHGVERLLGAARQQDVDRRGVDPAASFAATVPTGGVRTGLRRFLDRSAASGRSS